MKPITFQSYAYTPRFAAAAASASAPSGESASTGAPKDKFFQGSVKDGFTRTLNKLFARPRGWAQVAFCVVVPFAIPVVLAKHFVEGLVGVNSIYFTRRLALRDYMKQFGDRTLVDAIKGLWQKKEVAKS